MSLGFYNSDFAIENARVEAYYGNGQHVDRGGLKFYTREGDGLQTRMAIVPGGNIGIGTLVPTEKLTVNGKIKAREVRVDANGLPDYVFEPGYKNTSLADLEKYIRANKHLPEIPSAQEAEKNGLELGEMNKLLLKKIEELTLHLIEKEKALDAQQADIKMLKEHTRQQQQTLSILQTQVKQLYTKKFSRK